MCITLSIPATQDEAEHAVQGHCFDTSAVDGRIFACRAPDYACRHELLSLARFQRSWDLIVLTGVDQTPLLDETPVHLFPGELITFLPFGSAHTFKYTLGQQLQTRLVWCDWSLLPQSRDTDTYCLVKGEQTFLHFADPRAPARYREQIAHTAGISISTLQLQAAFPRPEDVELFGFACRTVIAASSTLDAHPDTYLHQCLLDRRPLGGMWQTLHVRRRGQRLLDLLPQISGQPPMGHYTTINAVPGLEVANCPGPGCIIVAEYVRASAVVASSPASGQEPVEAASGPHVEEGQGDTAIPSSGQDNNSNTPPVPGHDGALAPSVRVGEETGVPEDGLPFLLFAQEYTPEIVVWPGRLPASVPELFATLEQLRDADSHRRSPRLVPVYPQLQDSPPAILALPHWPFEGIAVLIDCRLGTRRTFATVLPGFLNREDVAFVAGIDPDSHYDVYAKDVPWPVPGRGRIYLTEGDRLLVCEPRHDPGHPAHIQHILQGAAPVTRVLPTIWVLSDGPFSAVPIRGDHFATDSAFVAEALALPAGHFSLVPSRPNICTHARRGVPSQGVFIACQTEDYPPEGPGDKVALMLKPYAPDWQSGVQPAITSGYTVVISTRIKATISDRLLQESKADVSCPAFWLAATLIDTLVEHFGGGSSVSGVTETADTVVVSLANSLPPAPTVDLSAVSLPLYQDIEQVVRWTWRGSWDLTIPLPRLLSLPAHIGIKLPLDPPVCSDGPFERIQIFTDGSFDGSQASWAFCAFAGHQGNPCFLGWAAGTVLTHPGESLFLSHCNISALCGEQHALLWAAIWALQSPCHVSLDILSDCLVALHQSSGSYGWAEDDTPMPSSHSGALAWLWLHIESALAPTHWLLHVGSSLVDTGRHVDATPLTVEESHRALGLPSPSEKSVVGRVFQASLLFMSVNVQSLTDKDSTASDISQQDGFTGKARYLREQLQHDKVQVAALQEARSPDDAAYVSDTHIRICTGRDPKGNFGCELWFSRTLPFVQADGACGTFHPKDLLTLSATPRELLVRFSRSGLHILFACIHAPVAGDVDRESWWLHLSQRLAYLSHGATVALLGDYNTGFSASVPARIGDLVWPAKHRVPEGFLSSILRRHDLWLPSTFRRYHTGQHETWISPTGTTGARLDYIAIPSHWCVPPSGSWVDTSLDWGQARVDHFGVGAQTYFVFGSKTQSRSKSVSFDRDTMCSDEGRQQLDQICRDIPLQPWDSNVHRHYLALEQHLTAALSVAFPAQRGNCRSSHFSSATWDVRQRRAWLRRHLARARTVLRLDEARAALLAWRRRVPVWVGRMLGVFPSILTARGFHGLVRELQRTKRQLRHLVRSDIRRRVQETAAAAASIPKADVVTRLRPLLGPPKRRQKQRRSLQTVCGPDGTPAATPDQAEDLWIAHFAGLEAGRQIDPTHLAERIFRRQQERDLDSYDLAIAEIPTRVALEKSLRQTQTGKALGTDNVPGELLHLAAGTASRALYQLFLKISLRASEPLQFKGGTLYAVWKGKSDPSACSSHRGILVSSTPGKAIHRLLRDGAIGALQNVAADMQIGGLPRFPVVLASHFVRLFQAGCRGRHLSHGLLFLDLREAFYRVVRPLLTGTNNSDEDVAAIVRAVSLPPGTMHELHKHLQGHSLAAEAGASQWTDRGLQDALDGTWFRFQGGHKVVETGIGSRPGDNLADVCFSFIFAKVLHSVRNELDRQNLLPTIPWSANLMCDIMPAHETPVSSLGSAVVDSCLGHALLPNLDRGKTEFVASPTGPGSRAVRANLFGGAEPGIRLQCRLWTQATVRLVPSYQHLGGYIHHDSSLVRELRHRASQAWQSFNSRKKRVFGAPRVAREDKRVLFESLILSVLLHGAGTWDAFSSREYTILESALHGMAFYMLRPEMTYDEVEPGKGNKRAADEGKYQTPSLQAQGPTLPEPLPQWTPYLERPSIEVVQCLSLIDYDSDGRQLGEDVVRERARLAFSAVCLPIPKILATVKAWKQHIDRHFVEEPSCNRTYTSVADWILSCDLFDWLVPTPSARCTQLNTFKDANSILQSLDLKGIVPTARPLCDDPTLIRVGPSDWIREFLKCTVSAVDEECLETFASGRTPSFIEDPPDDVIFIISVHQLPGWHALPSLPSKDRVFSAALAKATLSGDLLRFALRLWILGVPTTLIASDTEDVIPRKLQGRSTSLRRSLGCAGPRPLTTHSTRQPSKAHLQMSSTAPQLGLRTLPKPILQKPPDCFDLWREYDTVQHVSEEVEKKRQKQDKADKYRQALDLQMKQAQALREAEEVEKRQDRANMLAEIERAKSAATEELQKQQQKKEMLKEATAQQLVRAERHKRSAARRALRDQEAMDRTLELEEQFRQQELAERQRRRAVESQLMKTQFDMSQTAQERMKREEKEEDTQRALEWMRATSQPQDAELPGGMLHKIRENQKRVDTLVSTIGVAMVERQRAQGAVGALGRGPVRVRSRRRAPPVQPCHGDGRRRGRTPDDDLLRGSRERKAEVGRLREKEGEEEADEKLGPPLPEWGSIGIIQELKAAGIGFIRPHSGKVDDKDLFFHKSALKNSSFDALQIGDECTYEAVLDEAKGKAAAKNIVLKNGGPPRRGGGGGGGGRDDSRVWIRHSDFLLSGVECASPAAVWVLSNKEEALDLTIDRNFRAYEKKQTADFFAKKAERKRQAKELFATIKQQAAERRERGWDDKEADRWQAATWRQQDADFAESQRLAAERSLTARKEMDANLFGAMLVKAGAHKMEQGVSDKTRHRELLLNRPLVERMAQSGFKPEKTVAMLQQASAQKERSSNGIVSFLVLVERGNAETARVPVHFLGDPTC
ncbi:def6 [Symbiodinium microadriaticum]|nr:def6 [Symbiodinium microadriaticum]